MAAGSPTAWTRVNPRLPWGSPAVWSHGLPGSKVAPFPSAWGVLPWAWPGPAPLGRALHFLYAAQWPGLGPCGADDGQFRTPRPLPPPPACRGWDFTGLGRNSFQGVGSGGLVLPLVIYDTFAVASGPSLRVLRVTVKVLFSP